MKNTVGDFWFKILGCSESFPEFFSFNIFKSIADGYFLCTIAHLKAELIGFPKI